MISEIMVNPSAVEDAKGEWLELLNISSDSLDLTGLYLSDDDVDGTAITGAVVIESGQYVVLCAHRPTGDNGGVVCDTSYPYVTTGGGFSLTNTHDEVKVSADDGTLLDEVSYPEGSMPIGKSIGVDSDNLTPSRNDDINRWCIQTETMSGGDQGTPGSLNSSC